MTQKPQPIPSWVWVALLAWLLLAPGGGPGKPSVDFVAHVHQKPDIPTPEIMFALAELERQGIAVASIDIDIVNGEGERPEVYQPALEAADREGTPLTVYMDGPQIVKTIQGEPSGEEIIEAAQ